MKIVFAGTANFAVPTLQGLVQLCQQSSNDELVGVYTQPDRPQGRGRLLQSSPIKDCANVNHLPIYQPISLKKKAEQVLLESLQPDLIVVAAYGLLLPPAVLAIPKQGCINVHASLLPRWRGAAPIQRALLAGDTHTGITIMQMDAGLDTGDILYQVAIPIKKEDSATMLDTRLAVLGADAFIRTLQNLPVKQAARYAQPEAGVCYAQKLTKAEGVIHWDLPAVQIERQIRAFNPWPISFSWIQNKKLRIWQAKVSLNNDCERRSPGTIIGIDKTGIHVATGQGILQLTHIQHEGGRCLPVADLLHGSLKDLRVGVCFQE